MPQFFWKSLSVLALAVPLAGLALKEEPAFSQIRNPSASTFSSTGQNPQLITISGRVTRVQDNMVVVRTAEARFEVDTSQARFLSANREPTEERLNIKDFVVVTGFVLESKSQESDSFSEGFQQTVQGVIQRILGQDRQTVQEQPRFSLKAVVIEKNVGVN